MSFLNPSFSSQFLSGCLFIATLSFVVWFTLPSHPHNTQKYLTLYATFNNIDGITLHSPVTFSGIYIGHVTHIGFTDQEKTTATLTLSLTHPLISSQSLNLPDDSSIRIVTPSLFSKKTLLIEPGGSFDNLQDGDTFFFTQNALVFDDLLQYIMQPPEKNLDKTSSP